MIKSTLPAALVLAFTSGVASAHITLETKEATAGSTYKAVFRVPHGCDGAVRLKAPYRGAVG